MSEAVRSPRKLGGPLPLSKLSVEDLDLSNRRVLVRVDFNVPLRDGAAGTRQIADATRIDAVLPTLRLLLERKARVILISHLGRPKGKPVDSLSLALVVPALEKRLERKVHFCPHTIGAQARAAAEALLPGEVLILENLRFHAGEEAGDESFCRELAALADCYVSDAFGTLHRAHASTSGVAKLFPQAACGLLVAREIHFLENIFHGRRNRPVVAILGGAKISDKLNVVRALLRKADSVLLGGAMAYTFLRAEGRETGSSRVEEDFVGTAQDLLHEAAQQGRSLITPLDHIVAERAEADAQAQECGVDIPQGMMGLDIGKATIQAYKNILQRAKVVLWNGPMGVFELPPFREGTFAIARMLAESDALSVVGGGDSAAAVHAAGVAQSISHISTGGGAALKFIESRDLPGIVALSDA